MKMGGPQYPWDDSLGQNVAHFYYYLLNVWLAKLKNTVKTFTSDFFTALEPSIKHILKI
jgi:hypothetical protein